VRGCKSLVHWQIADENIDSKTKEATRGHWKTGLAKVDRLIDVVVALFLNPANPSAMIFFFFSFGVFSFLFFVR